MLMDFRGKLVSGAQLLVIMARILHKLILQKLFCVFSLFCLCILRSDCSLNSHEYDDDSSKDYSVGPLIQAVTPPGNLTETPHWDYVNQVLFYVDAPRQTLNKYDPKTERVTSTNLGGTVGMCIPVSDESHCGPNSFVCAINRDFVFVRWDGISSEPSTMKTLQSVEEDKPFNYLHDTKVDDRGVLWIGSATDVTMNAANLYRYSLDKCQLERVLSGVSISNGIAWNKDSTKMYYIDSPTRKVFSFDYDIKTSSIKNKRIAFDFGEYFVPGLPDGMTIDTDDNLWVCSREGARVIKIDPRRKSGKLLFTIIFPSYAVFSLTFGGPKLDVLYVTSGTYGLNGEQDAEQRAEQPLTGSVFAVYGLKASGRPANTALICCGQHSRQWNR